MKLTIFTSPKHAQNRQIKPFESGSFVLSFIFVVIILISLIVLAVYLIKQDRVITQKFEGKRWNLPAKVYSQSLDLQQNSPLTTDELENWLGWLNYQASDDYKSVGTYQKKGNTYYIHTRKFNFSNKDVEPKQIIKLQISNDKIVNLQSTERNESGKIRLEPILIGGIYPDNNEDRIVMQLDQIPKALIDALIATEDRGFFEHHGVSIRGTTRAIYSNLSGGARQGGSTITQQLIKNFYLNSDRTLKRKANEAIMALLLERHYSKQKILQTYINEITLGQNGNHSINGFGLASQFYFNRPLAELRLDQMALLVGLAKGPTQYNPIRYPKLALQRRNVVLNNMLIMGKIDQKTYDTSSQMPLDVVKKPSIGQSRFPDYLDIVKRELNKSYDADDLKNEGLRIFTSFNPNVQQAADKAVDQSLKQLKKSNPKRLSQLQSALVSANPQNGELLAVVGSGSEFTGFNRAVDAKRQVGSLLKPMIYLTGFEQGKYNLASGVDDSAINISQGKKRWSPSNYGGGSHGIVPLTTALANSYNQAAVRVGMSVGVSNIITNLQRMGVQKEIPNYPATLLGAVDLSPMDMLAVYQVLATGGIKHNIHTIRGVVDNEGRVIQGANFQKHQVINPVAAYLTNYAMQKVVSNGTAKAALTLGENLKLAGKTGTTNDYRDAWFAGYSGNYVSVVWVGLDNNQTTGLSGANGALPIWINFMRRLKPTPVQLPEPANIQWQWLENATGELSHQDCPNAIRVPIDTRYSPQNLSSCANDIHLGQQEAQLAEQQQLDMQELYDNEQQRLNHLNNPESDTPSDTHNNHENNQNRTNTLADEILQLDSR
ncbi:penicillin-binding protein 1B [Moraxella macacae 0408225]|uniref:Penicillin-binding protein 1B n=1 Tax=Moraxella macacae 0408225 TaxID=1230338 RepID=L2F5Z7_9GAMM|nr:penicillin-binding protein 1B [Moraxella macacae]ELA08325.1 penicillin-binding protein 1B [Moraxella macacae 0408225]